MKIGILTFHRAHNYGAVLQCYALQEVLKSMGHDVQVIDYRQPFIERQTKRINYLWLFKKICFPWKIPPFLKQSKANWEIEKTFQCFRQKHFNLTEKCNSRNIPVDFDVYVIGSDQLWSKCGGKELDSIYSGNFEPVGRKYTYAISSSVEYLKNVSPIKLRDILQRFSGLSFREKNVCEYVEANFSHKTTCCLDPTLLTDSSMWTPMIRKRDWSKRSYLLLYQVRPFEESYDYLYQKALIYAKERNLDLIDFTKTSFSVEDFVSAHKYAAVVFTTSFHSTVFSLLFERPFYAFTHGTAGDDRYVSLLKSVGLEQHVLSIKEEVKSEPGAINNINERLDGLRASSYAYLEQTIVC